MIGFIRKIAKNALKLKDEITVIRNEVDDLTIRDTNETGVLNKSDDLIAAEEKLAAIAKLEELAGVIKIKRRKIIFVSNSKDIGKQANKVEFRLVDEFGEEVGRLARTVSEKGRRTVYQYNSIDIESYSLLMNSNMGKQFEIPIGHNENLFFADFNIPIAITNEISGLGKIMLDDSLTFFKGNAKFKSVDGTLDLYKRSSYYSDYGGQSIILEQFWTAIDRGKSYEDAAFSTYAGLWAKENGFNRFWSDPVNFPLTEEKVLIKFLK